MKNKYKKILVIGSGPIVIGQAAEFDYAGVQACRALKSEGIEIVLVNSNPATIMTDENIADKVYIEPLTFDFVKKIIEKEKPQGFLASLGGQTALNLACELSDAGVLKENSVELLGTDISAIKNSEDRNLFKSLMQSIKEPVLQGETVNNLEDAITLSEQIGFPLVIRPAYTLGGVGGTFVKNKDEFESAIKRGLDASMIHQVLIEKSVQGYKEIEFEVIRDSADNCLVVCNMENIDSMGIHTGDSMVVAPCQTLSDSQIKMLEKASFKIIKALKIEGGCNIQYALNPNSDEYYVIEVNPRVSRSSALASKATGFPIAKINTKIAIGYKLTDFEKDIKNLEPKIDYTVVKIPKWSFGKFKNVDRTLTTQMKATGEVMALGKSFSEAFLKALFSSENKYPQVNDDVEIQDDLRIYRIFNAIKNGKGLNEIALKTKINKFFINEFDKVLKMNSNLSENKYFYKVKPCADKNKAENSYLYSSSLPNSEPVQNLKSQRVLIVGSGPIRIGQGIEFDYCCVQGVFSFIENQVEAILVNSNPETLSTDYDVATRLYFEPITIESVLNIAKQENIKDIVLQFGGQTAINLAEQLTKKGFNILGTSFNAINATEDRGLFSNVLKKLEIPQSKSFNVSNIDDALECAKQLTYPIIIRPSYTIGGLGVKKANDEESLHNILKDAFKISKSLLIEDYIEGLEVEADAIADGKNVLITGILEHVEKTGIHSGDSIAVYPTKNVTENEKQVILEYTQKIVKELNIKGLLNIQFVIKDGRVYVLEVNPRASRTVPILSKITGVNMCRVAVDIMLGHSLADFGYEKLLKEGNLFAVKVPVFSYKSLPNADKTLGTEMKSTGEVLGLDYNFENALTKAFIMANYNFDSEMPTFTSEQTKDAFILARENYSQNNDKFSIATIDAYRTSCDKNLKMI